ncbi:hypothetical protein OK016_19520 [Vibrio chagasii]|nr:hypothetical protein [Vibrio chagasii]
MAHIAIDTFVPVETSNRRGMYRPCLALTIRFGFRRQRRLPDIVNHVSPCKVFFATMLISARQTICFYGYYLLS